MRLFAAAAFLFAAPLFAQSGCTYIVAPTIFTIPAAQSFGKITVSQAPGSNCGPFTVSKTVDWLHPSAVTANSTSGDVTFIADANPGGFLRSGLIVIANQNVTVNQAAATCSFAIDHTSQPFQAAGGSGSFSVQASCAWAASPSDSSWIKISTGNQAGSSGVPVNFTVGPNRCVTGRNGSITVVTNLASPPVFSITQDGSPDNLTLSATGATASAAARDTRITVTTGDGCGWFAYSDVSWMQITGAPSGTGNGGFVYHLLENAGPARTGSIHVGALIYTVTQQAPAPPPVVLSTVANAASYATDAVSPGEIVTLFGANIGPGAIVTLQVSGATVTNNLAGTQVLFDGVAAPMIYSLAGQVSTVVPYGVAGNSTKVQVQYQGVPSNTLTIPVQSATPAIFSVDSSGSGPGAILNQDNSLNSSANPAARGSVIAIYLTGGGVTNPAGSDGAVTGVPPPLLAQAPAVTIGGVPAVVKYAGAAPGSVAGLVQINVEVPAGVANGLGLPVIVKIGSFASTGAATVAVK